MNKKNIFAFIVIVIFFLVAFFLIQHETHLTSSPLSLTRGGVGEGSVNIKYVELGGQKIKVDLALTNAEQEQGLSGRINLLPNTGMLFVFNVPSKPLFWMKDMNFPIDMIWLTPDMKVDYIEKNATPELYPTTYGPGVNDGAAEYVLETMAGFADSTHLQIGDSVQFTY